MYQFFESIRVVNGRVMNLNYHQQRVDRCLLQFSKGNKFSLKKEINNHFNINIFPKNGVYKLRISYNAKVAKLNSISIEKYIEKPIQNIQLIHVNELEYIHKSEDRTQLTKALNTREKSSSQDILLVKNGFISDSSYCNVALFDGTHWHTPKECLLPGIMRQKLINKGIIKIKSIHYKQLKKYSKLRLFNAMIPWNKKKDVNLIFR